MIIGNLTDSARYATLSPAIAQALEWLRDNLNTPEFEPGKKIILSPDVVINCQEVQLRAEADAPLEAHREWIDIQVSIDTPEAIGWIPTPDCKQPTMDYDSEGDYILFADRPQVAVPMLPGQFMILYPEDAHAPNIGTGTHRKYVAKVRL